MNRRLVVFSAVLLALAFGLILLGRYVIHPGFLIPIVVVLAALTWLVVAFIFKTKSKDLVRNYLLTIVLKLLAGGIFIFVLLFADPAGANANALFFMTCYLLFTTFEVGFLFRTFR